jgi:hypothetical protein
MAARPVHADMPYRVLGRTGAQVSAIGLGGWHLGFKHVDEPLSLRIVRSAIDRGLHGMDHCWDYNGGASETRMGNALRDGYRHKAFLLTKIDGRSKQDATKQLEDSLRRLQTDCIDLVQHREILRDADPHRIFRVVRHRSCYRRNTLYKQAFHSKCYDAAPTNQDDLCGITEMKPGQKPSNCEKRVRSLAGRRTSRR